MAKILLNFIKNIIMHTQETQQTPLTRHIIVTVKSQREKSKSSKRKAAHHLQRNLNKINT